MNPLPDADTELEMFDPVDGDDGDPDYRSAMRQRTGRALLPADGDCLDDGGWG